MQSAFIDSQTSLFLVPISRVEVEVDVEEKRFAFETCLRNRECLKLTQSCVKKKLIIELVIEFEFILDDFN